MNIDEFLQQATLTLHDIWTQNGGDDIGEFELQNLNDHLGAWFGDKIIDKPKPTLSNSQINFFEVEIANQVECEGDFPATLNTAIDSLNQAPDDVIIDWCGEPDIVHDRQSIQEFVESIEQLRIEYNGAMWLVNLLPDDLV